MGRHAPGPHPFAGALLSVALLSVLVACEDEPDAADPVLPLAEGRAYSGAPPLIPHAVQELGRAECQQCHARGDVVDPRTDLRAPQTPHPELSRCRQCHVEPLTEAVFRSSSFAGRPYAIGMRAQPEGPWSIPHPLTMRENCLGCHGPNSAEGRLRTDHPERERCVMCHVPANGSFPGPRPAVEVR